MKSPSPTRSLAKENGAEGRRPFRREASQNRMMRTPRAAARPLDEEELDHAPAARQTQGRSQGRPRGGGFRNGESFRGGENKSSVQEGSRLNDSPNKMAHRTVTNGKLPSQREIGSKNGTGRGRTIEGRRVYQAKDSSGRGLPKEEVVRSDDQSVAHPDVGNEVRSIKKANAPASPPK